MSRDYRQSFASVSEVVTHVTKLPQHKYDYTERFHGGNVATARNLSQMGWREGAEEAADIAERIADRAVQSTSVDAIEPVIAYDVCGVAYDPGAYGSGVPECWSTLQPTEGKKGIRIVIDPTVSSKVKKDVIVRRGIAVAALVMALQSRGYVVTLDVVSCFTPEGERRIFRQMVRVIDGALGSVLDIDRVVYALAHPTFFRVVLSSAANGFSGASCGSFWGKSEPLRERPSDEVLGGPCDLFIGPAHALDAKRWTDGGEAWVLAEFNRQTSV